MRIYERKLCLCMLVAGGDGERLAAVNLGGWLVIEKWIKPSIWEGIPNDDLLVLFFTILLTLHSTYILVSTFCHQQTNLPICGYLTTLVMKLCR